jgi:hypothetical protein
LFNREGRSAWGPVPARPALTPAERVSVINGSGPHQSPRCDRAPERPGGRFPGHPRKDGVPWVSGPRLRNVCSGKRLVSWNPAEEGLSRIFVPHGER